jgi:hypothetical protein
MVNLESNYHHAVLIMKSSIILLLFIACFDIFAGAMYTYLTALLDIEPTLVK